MYRFSFMNKSMNIYGPRCCEDNLLGVNKVSDLQEPIICGGV